MSSDRKPLFPGLFMLPIVLVAAFFLGNSGYVFAADPPTCSAQKYVGDDFRGMEIRSGFGTRESPVDPRTGARGSTFHRALDLRINNPNVGAFYGGTVVHAGERGGWGNTVIVRNGNFEVQYAHAGNLNVREGQTVNPGDVLGNWSRCSGTCSGPHVDLIYRVNNNGNWTNVDPVLAEQLIKQGYVPGSDEFTQAAIKATTDRCQTDESAFRTRNPSRPGGLNEQDLMCDPRIRARIDEQVKAFSAMRQDAWQNTYRPPVSSAALMKVPCKSNELQRISNQFAYAPTGYASNILGQVSGAAGPVSGLLNNMVKGDIQSFMNTSKDFGGLFKDIGNLVQGQLSSLLSSIPGLSGSPFASALCGIMADTLLKYIQCEVPINMPSLGNITGSLNKLLPKGCAGDALRSALYASASQSAFRPLNQSIGGVQGGIFSSVQAPRLTPLPSNSQ